MNNPARSVSKVVSIAGGGALYPVVSLFSGAMGLDLGLEEAGLHTAVAQDYDKWCVETIRCNGRLAVGGDLRTLVAEDPACNFLLKPAKLRAGDVFAVVGGPPCQSFSTAGKRLGVDDARGTLYNQFPHVVQTLLPRFFVMENVKGLASTPSIAGDKSSPPLMQWRTLFHAIGDLHGSASPDANFSPKINQYLGHVPEGGNWRSLPPTLVQAAMGGAYKSGSGKVGFYRRLTFTEPAPTLVTSPVQKKATLLCHPRETLSLSVAEYARIQGFPDHWKFEGKPSDCSRQIGSAVPVRLGRAIGPILLTVAQDNSQVRVWRMRGTSVHKGMQVAAGGATAPSPRRRAANGANKELF